MIYDLCKIDIDNEKLLKKLLSDISRSIKKLLKKLIIFITNPDFVKQMKKKYPDNDIV